MPLALVAHIVAGGIGIISGFVAIFVLKGATVHRRSGVVFVYAMLTMSLLGALIAAVRSVAPTSNIPVALLTAYLVITALTTVRPPAAGAKWIELGLTALAFGVGVFLVGFGVNAMVSPAAKKVGAFVIPFLIFATIALVAAIGDVRVMRQGGIAALRGSRRLGRHLWRMSFALLIATFSFFLGQAKVIPKPMRIVPLLMVPPLIVLAVMLYWMWRVGIKRSNRRIVIVEAERTEIPAAL